MFFGYPATVSGGFFGSIPPFGKAVAPFGKGFGCPFGKGFGFPGKGFGFPSTFGGFGTSIPATTVATSPFPF